MAFIGPDSPVSQTSAPAKPAGFIGPDAPVEAPVKQEPTFVDNLVSKAEEASKRLLSPIAAITKPVSQATDRIVSTPQDVPPPPVNPNTLASFKQATQNLPKNEGEPGLESPTGQRLLENANIVAGGYYTPKLAEDVVKLGMKAGSKLLAKSPLEQAVEEIAAIKPLPKPPVPETAKAPLMEEKGLQGKLPTVDELKAQLGVQPEVAAKAPAAPVAKAPVVPEAPKELPVIQSKDIPTDKPVAVFRGSGFGGDFYDIYNQPGINNATNIRATFSGEDAVKKIQDLNIPVIGKIPEAGAKNPKVTIAAPKTPEPVAPTPAASEPVPAPKPSPQLPEGAAARIAPFSKPGKDINAFNPLSTSAELTEKVDQRLRISVRDTLQSGLKAEVEGQKAANKTLQEIHSKFPYKPGSADSAAVSTYGRSPDKLQARAILDRTVGPVKAREIVEADAEYRKVFDAYRLKYNDYAKSNGLPEIPYKEDYYTQVHDYNLLNSLGLSKQIGTAEGDATVAKVLTDNEQAIKSKWYHKADIDFKHLNKQGAADLQDAVTSLSNYVNDVERKISLQPHVNELRQAAEAMKEQFPNLSKAYIERADHIAGKEQSIDAAIKNVIGPKAFNIYNEATRRMKSNLISFNPSVPVSQTFVLPSIAADLPVQDSITAGAKLVSDPAFRNFLIENSPTLQLRLAKSEATGLHEGKLLALGNAPSNWVDMHTLLYALAGKTTQLVRQGVPLEEAVKEAEQFASLTQATLSKLNTAPILRSKTVQSALPFMNQVLSQSRFVTTQLFKNKTMGEKAATAAKFAATGLGLATATQLLLGEKTNKTPLDATQYVPMGSALEQGIGGPVIGSAGRILKAPTVEDKLLETFKAGMLLQNKIPGGLQVSNAVTSLFKSKKKN